MVTMVYIYHRPIQWSGHDGEMWWSLYRVITVHFLQQFPSVLISHVLKAMGLGSPIATQLFPRLLQLVEKYPDTRKLFQAKVTIHWCFLCHHGNSPRMYHAGCSLAGLIKWLHCSTSLRAWLYMIS